MSSKISPISRSEVVDYRDKLVTNFWRTKDREYSCKDGDYTDQLIDALQSVTEGMVCIQSGKITDSKIVEQLLHTANGRRVKIYILVNEYSTVLDTLQEKCLIRYDLNTAGSFILINPNTDQAEGRFFNDDLSTDSLKTENQLFFDLSKKEVSELFRHFCFHFWESANKEVIEKGKHLDVVTKPIDVFHNEQEHKDRDFVYATLFDFVAEATRADVSSELIVPSKKENEPPIRINTTSKIDLGEVVLDQMKSHTEFERHIPELPDDGSSCKIEYSWITIPFYLPEKSTRSQLYDQWTSQENKVQNYLDSILKRIEETEKKESIISASLKRFFLGKKTAFNQFKSDLHELKQVKFSNLPESELHYKVKKVNEIQVQVDFETGEIERENKKVKLDESIILLEEKKSATSLVLEKSIEDLSNKKVQAAKSLKEFLDRSGIEEAELGKLKNRWEQQVGKKNRKKNPGEADEAEEKLNDLKTIENRVFIDKNESEVERLEKEVKRIEDEIKSKGQEKLKLQQLEKPESSLSDFLSDASSLEKSNSDNHFLLMQLPQLPQVGELYESGDQSYLAIEYWDQYEQATKEAQRLKAKLCAIKIIQ